MNVKWHIGLLLVLGLITGLGAEREMIQDPHFRRGFVLWETKPGKHVRYGELKGLEGEGGPVWGLSQWSSRFPLEPAMAVRSADFLQCSNRAKGVKHTKDADLVLAANSRVEYGTKARKARDPWVHLLVEQEFEKPARLAELKSAKLHVEARLVRSQNLHEGDYTTSAHAAQFQLFFTVQNRNRQSKGFGIWYGLGFPFLTIGTDLRRRSRHRILGGQRSSFLQPEAQRSWTRAHTMAIGSSLIRICCR